MWSDRVVVLPPFLDDDLRFLQAIEDFAVQQLIAKFCCDIPASRQATGVGLPCAIDTSIWRSSITICSAPNLFFGMTGSFPSSFSHNAWSKKARSGHKTNQVNNNQPPTLRQRRPRFRDRGLVNFQPPVSSSAPRRSRHLIYATLRPLKPSSDPAMNQQYTRGRC